MVVIKAAVGEGLIVALSSATELPLSAHQSAGGRCQCCFCICICIFFFASVLNRFAVGVVRCSEQNGKLLFIYLFICK